MLINLLWQGIEYTSLENCIVDIKDEIKIKSTIIGNYKNAIYKLVYEIDLNKNWGFTSCKIHFQHNLKLQEFNILKTGNNWYLNGELNPVFSGCNYIDIPLTPLTNSLPINNLKMMPEHEEIINVLYIDLLENSIRPLKQKYIKLGAGKYKYENVPNDFEAEIITDENGLVDFYPALFRCIGKMVS